MKEQDKIPEKQLNELMIDNFPGKKKKNQNNESESDSGSRKKSEGKD